MSLILTPSKYSFKSDLTFGILDEPPTKTISEISSLDNFASHKASFIGTFNLSNKSLHNLSNSLLSILSKISSL